MSLQTRPKGPLLEPRTGLEPVTFRLQGGSSTNWAIEAYIKLTVR